MEEYTQTELTQGYSPVRHQRRSDGATIFTLLVLGLHFVAAAAEKVLVLQGQNLVLLQGEDDGKTTISDQVVLSQVLFKEQALC